MTRIAGQILTPLYLTWVLASIVAARVLFKYGPRICTLSGTLAVALSTVLLPLVVIKGVKPWIFADIALMGAGLGFSMLAMLLAMQQPLTAEMAIDQQIPQCPVKAR